MRKAYHLSALLPLLCMLLVEVKPGLSQEVAVTNVTFTLVGRNVIIHYNLSGPPKKMFNVVVTLRREGDPEFRFVPIDISGNVGKGPYAGIDREIVWHMYRDIPSGLEGDNYYFQVTASVLNSGGSPWFYYVGGAIILGGSAAAVLYKLESTAKSAGSNFPTPPIRP